MRKNIIKIMVMSVLFTFIFTMSMLQNKSDTVLISVYRTESKIVQLVPLETYVEGVLSCEVPSSFHIEALKAQAVASRTYAIAKTNQKPPQAHPLAPLCDSTHCQVYANNTTCDKIKKAVQETKSELLYYHGEIIEYPLFHASSGGRTENSEDVFVSAVPYLKSVDSPFESEYARNGHGVGMSQQGANGMAKEGYSYKKILSHFYSSGTVVR